MLSTYKRNNNVVYYNQCCASKTAEMRKDSGHWHICDAMLAVSRFGSVHLWWAP